MINYQNKIYIFGGAKKDGHLNDVYEVDLETGPESSIVSKVLPISTFPNLYEFTSILDGHKLWIFGGADKLESKNDIYKFNMESLENECKKVSAENGTEAPAPRTQYGNKSLVEIDGSNHLVVFGGGCKEDKPVDDRNLHLFNLETSTWNKVQTNGIPPSARQGHISISIGQTVYIHGGLSFDDFCDDTFLIDLSKSDNKWIEIQCDTRPCPRAAHNVAAISDAFYIFGGFDSMGHALSDLWKFNTKSLTWTQIKYLGEVSPRMDFAMYAIVTERKTNLLIHGGFNSDCVFYDDIIQFSIVDEEESTN